MSRGKSPEAPNVPRSVQGIAQDSTTSILFDPTEKRRKPTSSVIL
jgi:hypothetical protein